jgi:hypothetical protein
MGLGHHQTDTEQHQRRAGIVDGQQVERIERDQEADAPDQTRGDRPRIEEFEYQTVHADQHQNESHVRIGDDGEQLGPPVRRRHHHVESRRRQAFGFSRHLHRPSIDLAQKIGHVIGDHVDDMKLERLGRREAYRRAHRLRRPIRVAAVELGQAADVGHGVVHRLAGLGVRRLGGGARLILAPLLLTFLFSRLFRSSAGKARRPSQLYRGGGAEVGAGSHGGDRARIGDVGARARRPRAARCHIGGNRHRRGQDGANDGAHGRVEPARRIHAQDNEARVGWPDPAKLTHDVVGNRRTNRTVDLEHQRARRRRNFARRQRQGDHRGKKRAHDASIEACIDTAGGGPSRRRTHGPPPRCAPPGI